LTNALTTLTLQQLNQATLAEAKQMLDGVYEHSPWIAEEALTQRPFASINHLKHAMAHAVLSAASEKQLTLVLAHP
jgi:beta-ureidopropionase / N-carbamoyl-L-amino-acid hydrolase